MKKLNDYYWICPEPFTNVFTSPGGRWKPCCILDDKDYEKYSNVMTVETHTYEEFWHSEFMVRLRKALKDKGDDKFLNDVCRGCKTKELVRNKSFREWYIERFTEGPFKKDLEELEKIIATDSEPTFYHSVEHSALTGNLCNLACNMCSGEASSKYRADEIALKEVKEQPIITKPKIKKMIDFSKVRELKLTGGEPFMSKEAFNIIEEMKPDTRLRIITNGTITIHDYSIFEKFKQVNFNLSVEGPKEITEYIRFPSKWNVIQKNRQKMEDVPNSIVTYVTTVNALNIARLPEIKGSHNSLVQNNSYSLHSIPDDIKEIYLDKLFSFGLGSKLGNARAFNPNGHNDNIKLIKFLENVEHNEEQMWKMLAHIKRRDRLRGTNLIDVFPEWENYYNKVII